MTSLGGVMQALSQESTWLSRHGDAVWGGAVGVIATVIVGWIFYALTLRPKKLDYFVLGADSLFSVPEAAAAMPLQVVKTGDGPPGAVVAEPNLIRVRVMNTGKQAIHGHEMDPRLHFALSDSAFVVGIVTRQSGDVAVHLVDTDDAKVVEVDLNFLNPDEWFEAQFITSGRPEKPRMYGRISGQERPVRNLEEHYRRRTYVFGTIFWSALLTAAALAFFGSRYPDGSTQASAAFVLLLLAGVVTIASEIIALSASNKPGKLRAKYEMKKPKVPRWKRPVLWWSTYWNVMSNRPTR